MKTTSALLLAVMVLVVPAAPGQVRDLPPKVQRYVKGLEGKGPREVLPYTVAMFGRANRDLGSGIHILEWDIDGGVLTFGSADMRSAGPPIYRLKGKSYWLVATHNRLSENLEGDFEMTSLPIRGMTYYLGNVALRKGRYRFTDSNTNGERRRPTFFLGHNQGTYKIHFVKGINARSLLESLPEKTVIGRFEFLPSDGGKPHSFAIRLDALNRRLKVVDSSKGGFSMSRSWINSWK